MRKITKEAVSAFWDGVSFNKDNTSVVPCFEGATLSLHGNNIASYSKYDGKLFISSCGWLTNTTKERLNGILLPLCKKIYQVKDKWYLHDVKTDIEVPFYDGMEIEL